MGRHKEEAERLHIMIVEAIVTLARTSGQSIDDVLLRVVHDAQARGCEERVTGAQSEAQRRETR